MSFASVASSATFSIIVESDFQKRIKDEFSNLPAGLAKDLSQAYLFNSPDLEIELALSTLLEQLSDQNISTALAGLKILSPQENKPTSNQLNLMVFGFLYSLHQTLRRLLPRETRNTKFPGLKGALSREVRLTSCVFLEKIAQDSPLFDESLPSFDHLDQTSLKQVLLDIPKHAKCEFGIGFGTYVAKSYLLANSQIKQADMAA